MAFSPAVMGYDRALTVFSPDGKLYQVQYAFEAVKQGWSTLGIRVEEGVVLAAEKAQIKPLMDLNSVEKISPIDEHVGVTFAGFGGDGRILIEYARNVSIQHRMLYGEPVPIEYLTKQVSDVAQAYTQHGGVRPFGASLLIGGVDDGGPRLFKTDPAGQYFSYYATSIGRGEAQIEEKLEKNYRKDMSLRETVELAIRILKEVSEQEIKAVNLEVAVIPVKTRKFYKYSEEEINGILKSI